MESLHNWKQENRKIYLNQWRNRMQIVSKMLTATFRYAVRTGLIISWTSATNSGSEKDLAHANSHISHKLNHNSCQLHKCQVSYGSRRLISLNDWAVAVSPKTDSFKLQKRRLQIILKNWNKSEITQEQHITHENFI